MSEYQKYDSDSEFKTWAPRLAKDAEVITTKNGEMTKLTFVHTSAGEDDEEMWLEAIINDGQSEKAAGLVKGDVPAGIDGFLSAKRSHQDPTKIFYTLKRARIHFGVALLTELKERGGPKKSKPSAKPGVKPSVKGVKPVVKPASKQPARPIIEDDEDDADDGEE